MRRSKRVLIVDDDRDNREAYAEYLRFRGFAIHEAATGAAALDMIRECDPDVVLLDMRLPDAKGTEISRQVRAGGAKRPAIVALSASVFEVDVAAALENGCDLFLPKPCLPDALETEIRRLLHMRASA
jgi:two-component system, cell cycle response regulator DivK